MHPSLGPQRPRANAAEPCIGLAAWHAAPFRPPVTLAFATACPERQGDLAAAFATSSRTEEPSGRALRLVPDAVIVDRPELLAHRAVMALLAPASVVLGADGDLDRAVAIVRAGADALLPDGVAAADLRAAVDCVLRGEAVVPAAVAAAVALRVRAVERLS